jgi:hypothetical protein
VRGVTPDFGDATDPAETPRKYVVWPSNLYKRDSYPADAPVMNRKGEKVMGVTAEEPMPWCIVLPDGEILKQRATDWAASKGIALCPDAAARMNSEDARVWATRGAINAGLSVFLYLQGIAAGAPPALRYDQCEQLPKED